jgi:hypothetical protein
LSLDIVTGSFCIAVPCRVTFPRSASKDIPVEGAIAAIPLRLGRLFSATDNAISHDTERHCVCIRAAREQNSLDGWVLGPHLREG